MLPLFLHPRAEDAPIVTLSVAAVIVAYISIYDLVISDLPFIMVVYFSACKVTTFFSKMQIIIPFFAQ